MLPNPEEIVHLLYAQAHTDDNKENDCPEDPTLQKEDLLNRLNLQGVPAQFIESLVVKIDEVLGAEISHVSKRDFLHLFTSWLEEFQSADDGAYYDNSFADLCNSSCLSDSRPDLSGIYSQGNSSASSVVSEEQRDGVAPILSPIRGRSISFQHLNRPLYDETISVGSYTGYGGQSPQKRIHEATSMELCNSKLSSDIEYYKTFYQRGLSENERLQQNLDAKEREFKSILEELDQLKKQYKMLRLSNDNLNADIDHMNGLREQAREKDIRTRELELELKAVNDDCEKAWDRVNVLGQEKNQLISDLEEEGSKNIILRQELTLERQVMANQIKELNNECDELKLKYDEIEGQTCQYEKDIESRSKERDEYKLRCVELEHKIQDSGEVIYFSPSQPDHQKNLQDELEQSADFKVFQFEEVQTLKKKLDESLRVADQADRDKAEAERKAQRLDKELLAIRSIQQVSTKDPPNVLLANAASQTKPVNDTIGGRESKQSAYCFEFNSFSPLMMLFTSWTVLLSLIFFMIVTTEGPIIDYSCPSLSATFY